MISIEKPGSPEELVHFGKKGMKWGVRTQRSITKSSAFKNWSKLSNKSIDAHNARVSRRAAKPPMSTKKKVAISVGVAATVAVGAIAVNHYLKTSGKAPLSSLLKSNKRPFEASGNSWKAFARSPREEVQWQARMSKTLSNIQRSQQESLARVERR